MELVPIVIIALEIVAVLAVIVLLSSYIAFKIRSKAKPLEEKTVENANPKFVNRGTKHLTRRTKETVHTSRSSKSVNHSGPTHHSEKIKKEVAKPERHIQRDERRPKRLKIITQLPIIHDVKTEKNQNETEKQKESLKSLGDDILKKYDDDNDDQLYNLKTDKINPKE
jgi:hypothetical protein